MAADDNIGSRARDLLANERTFLAWIRTGLGLIGVGVVLAKWVETPGSATLLGGLMFILWGTAVMAYALVRYRRITALLERGKYQPARVGPMVLTLAGLLAAAAAIAVVLL